MNFNNIKWNQINTILEDEFKGVRERVASEEFKELERKVQERLNEIEEI